MQQGNTP